MEFKVFDLGLIDFEKAWGFQQDIFSQVKNNYFKAALILCRHYPVFTLGRLGKKENIKIPVAELQNKKIGIYHVERGGDITYHGPGQLIAYPIFNLNFLKKDIHLFLRQLEEVAMDFLFDFGIKGLRRPGLTGVWINPVRNTKALNKENKISNGVNKKKVASIGIAIKNWVTFHGLSINIKKDDLSNFQFIKPCGMDIEMTSLETALNKNIEIEEIKENLICKFRSNFLIAN